MGDHIEGKIDDVNMAVFMVWVLLTPLIFVGIYILLWYVQATYNPYYAAVYTWNELCNAWDDTEDF